MMVRLTIIGRMNDGLPISQGPIYTHSDEEDTTIYKQHAEFLLREISMAALPPSATTILLLHHHCFNYIVRNGICFIALCDASYPRLLAFLYLQDLEKEFNKIDPQLVKQISKPYSFLKFDNIIGTIRRQYIDTRTQANLSKLNAHQDQLLHIPTQNMSLVVERRKRSDMLERMMKAHKSSYPVWGSKTLEVIAVKWTPITIIFIVAFLILWSNLLLKDSRF